MIQRIVTSIEWLVVFFFVLFYPFGLNLPADNILFQIAVLLISMIAVYEVHKAVTNNKPLKILGILMCVLINIAVIFNQLLLCLVFVFSVYLFTSVLMFGKEKITKVYMLGFLTIIFSTFIATIGRIKVEYSVAATFLPFLFAWITDSGAYFIGSAFGKHKLAPKLSPKKSIEGAVGGVIVCMLISALYVFILNRYLNISIFGGNDYIKIIIVSFVASIISQFGDLACSAIKREYDIKDFGKIFVGHGGVLDRFDSVVFVSPFVYLLLMVLA